jgi:hypothetical protein
MAIRHSRLIAGMAAAWEAEVVSSRVLAALADRISNPKQQARISVLAAFCRAHASRVLARLSAIGRSPLPVPPEQVSLDDDLGIALRREATSAHSAASHYEFLAQLAREKLDLSSAWVCELNRTEEEDRSLELLEIAKSEDGRIWQAPLLHFP